ncbi:MAG: hypothetical protein AABZ64_07340 [Nitrospinota bacterium]
MERNEVEQAGHRLIALRQEKESLSFQSNASEADKRAMIAALPARLAEEALAEATSLLGRLAPGDGIKVEDLDAALVVTLADGIVGLLTEALEAAPENSHGQHDLSHLTARRAELDKEIARLEETLSFAVEGNAAWPSQRLAVNPKTLEAEDAWSPGRTPLRAWRLEEWLRQLPAETPGLEPKRGPGRRPKAKIAAGLREGRP